MTTTEHPFRSFLPAAEIEPFLADAYEERPHHFSGAPFPDCGFDLRAFFEILRDTVWTGDEKLEFVPDKTQKRSPETRAAMLNEDGQFTLDRILMCKKQKCSLYMRSLELRHQGLRKLQHDVERTGIYQANVNAFYTPAGARTAPDHWDTYDLFALQVSGEKLWHVADTPDIEAVVYDRSMFSDGKYAVTDPKPYLPKPRDVLYVPRGVGHYAEALDTDSLHLVVGVHPIHWHQLLSEFVHTLTLQDARLRKPVTGRNGEAPSEAQCAEIAGMLTPQVIQAYLAKMIRNRKTMAMLTRQGQAFAKDIDALL